MFFGREGQSDIIINNLKKSHFSAITGASGSGKSSLIYCGVLPALYGGFIPEAGSNWRVITFRPGSSPFDNLASAIFNAAPHISADESDYYKSVILSILKKKQPGAKRNNKAVKGAKKTRTYY
ncbi:MAG: hypothetical protein HC896_15290 [Bacteroidales bacterium]|nr:hypothetical protein [Bacteroidales bacterium]